MLLRLVHEVLDIVGTLLLLFYCTTSVYAPDPFSIRDFLPFLPTVGTYEVILNPELSHVGDSDNFDDLSMYMYKFYVPTQYVCRRCRFIYF